MRKEFTAMEKSCPSTPGTPTVVKGDLRRKLMKTRSSIGIARMKQMKLATRLPDNNEESRQAAFQQSLTNLNEDIGTFRGLVSQLRDGPAAADRSRERS